MNNIYLAILGITCNFHIQINLSTNANHAMPYVGILEITDRAGLTSMANGKMFKRKVGAAVVAVRRGGSIHTFNVINHFFFIGQMIVPGSNYWNMGFGLDKGDVEKDEEGLGTMKVLGENMAWLLKKIHG